MAADYRVTGIPFDPPATRVARLEEAVQVIKAFFAGGPVTFHGEHYQVDGLEGFPRPIQQPRPPILIAGSRPRMLRLAAREADIVGLEDHQFAERATGEATIHAADADEQIEIVRAAAGDRFSEIELNVFSARVTITDDRQSAFDEMAAQLQTTPEQVASSASFLVGSVDTIVETLQERRERLGVSYVMVFDRVMDAFAPVVARLAGT
jgi:probable F420-dependent oxidoreductase